MPTVNKRELAGMLSVSLPTLDEMLRRYPDFPVVTRGSNGVAWEFDAEASVAFVRGQKERDEAEAASRAHLLAQFRIPGLDDDTDRDGSAKPGEVLQLVKAQRARHDMAKEAGQLLWRTDVRQQLSAAVVGLNRFIHGLPGQLGRRFNLSDEVIEHMTRLVADQQEEFTRSLGELLPPDVPRDAP